MTSVSLWPSSATFCLLLLLHTITTTVQAFTLLTFDVDGTLVKGSGKAADESAHARAFGHAVGSLLGDGSPTQLVSQALPRTQFHGSTDGLILLRLARATVGVEPVQAYPQLDVLMECMYEFISEMDDAEVADGISVLPGVLDQLTELSNMKDDVLCGLVTGNVEGIARRKMNAVGVFQTGALAPPSDEQLQREWKHAQEIGFLGGFGSDYCSGDIDNADRNHLDRAEQIAIAAKRGQSCRPSRPLKRVVHIGDAPADVLAAKHFAMTSEEESFVVGCVAVATGSYPADLLRELAGEPIAGVWEPVILEDGMADPNFLKACGL